MSMVLWIRLETCDEDDSPDDMGLMLDELDALDAQCVAQNVAKLGDFVDYSDVAYNASDEDLGEEWLVANTKYVNPAELLLTLRALEAALDAEEKADLLEEIHYAIVTCVEAEKQSGRVQLLMVT